MSRLFPTVLDIWRFPFVGGGMERLKKKLLHQKEGKARLKKIGNVQIPKEAFINIFKS